MSWWDTAAQLTKTVTSAASDFLEESDKSTGDALGKKDDRLPGDTIEKSVGVDESGILKERLERERETSNLLAQKVEILQMSIGEKDVQVKKLTAMLKDSEKEKTEMGASFKSRVENLVSERDRYAVISRVNPFISHSPCLIQLFIRMHEV